MTLFRNSIEENPSKELDMNALFNWINAWSDPIDFTVATAGVEVAVSHEFETIPDSVLQIVRQSATGQGVVIPGTTAWTTTAVYLTATVAGDYAILLRRE